MVSDLKTFSHKGYKIDAQKQVFFFGKFCLTSRIFLVSVLISASAERFFVSRMRDFSTVMRSANKLKKSFQEQFLDDNLNHKIHILHLISRIAIEVKKSCR